MSTELHGQAAQARMRLKAAAYELAALIGAAKASGVVSQVARELSDSLWEGSGSR